MSNTHRNVANASSHRTLRVVSGQRAMGRVLDDLQENGFTATPRERIQFKRRSLKTPVSYDDLPVSAFDEFQVAVPKCLTLWWSGCSGPLSVELPELKETLSRLQAEGVPSVSVNWSEYSVVIGLQAGFQVQDTQPESLTPWSAERLLGLRKAPAWRKRSNSGAVISSVVDAIQRKPSLTVLVGTVLDDAGYLVSARLRLPDEISWPIYATDLNADLFGQELKMRMVPGSRIVELNRDALMVAGFGRKRRDGSVVWRFWKIQDNNRVTWDFVEK